MEGSGQVSGNRIYKQVPKGTVESLSLEIFRDELDNVLDIEGEPALSWTRRFPGVPSNPHISMVPWFCDWQYWQSSSHACVLRLTPNTKVF